MKKEDLNRDLMAFIAASPTPFHAVAQMWLRLTDAGFTCLAEVDNWDLKPGKYFVTRNDSSIIAFILGSQDPLQTGIRMVGAHTDSPCLKVKPRPEKTGHTYLQLGVEVYGGVLLNPWFDRDLSLAGRVTVHTDKGIESHLINFERPVAIIPSLAIHLDREANTARTINSQKDIPPLVLQTEALETGIPQKEESQTAKEQIFTDLIKRRLEEETSVTTIKQILGYELCLYDVQAPSYVGFNREFISSARLDNLLSCYLGMTSLLESDGNVSNLLVCNDHEEVGSASAAGAQGPFLKSVLERIIKDTEERTRAMAKSLLISTDNAHGIHPNFPDRHDSNHGPVLNRGPVIKINSNQRYATNSETEGLFRWLCDESDVPCQTFVSRTDMACGSTIGPITTTAIGVPTLDVGLPTFAMHSIRELCGSDDPLLLYKVLNTFYQKESL